MMALPPVAAPCQSDQVGDKDSPPDPPLKALQSMIRTARQLDGPAHHTNAPFNAIANPLAMLEPSLLFMRTALRSFGAGLREGNLLNPQALRQAFIGGREQALISGQQPRGVPEAGAMTAEDFGQQLLIRGIADGNEWPVANEAPFHCGIVDFMAELRLPWARLTPANDLRMGFTEADHFLLGWEYFVVEHTPHCLSDRLCDQGQQGAHSPC
jgi:hypothetical protein